MQQVWAQPKGTMRARPAIAGADTVKDLKGVATSVPASGVRMRMHPSKIWNSWRAMRAREQLIETACNATDPYRSGFHSLISLARTSGLGL